MSECVVRMEMPKNCMNCDLRYECNAFYTPGKPKPFMKGCRIVCQLPKGHGRLGDLNRLEKIADAVRIDAIQKGHDTNPYWLLEDIIAQAKTIVPAERSANERKQKKYTNWIGEEMVEQQIDKDVSRFADGEWWKEAQE